MDKITPKYTYSIAMKREVMEEVKKYPLVWNYDGDKRKTDNTWKYISDLLDKKLNLHKGRYRRIWNTLRRYYLDVLEDTVSKYKTRIPQWELFHDMMFFYDSAKKIVESKTGKKLEKFTPTNPTKLPCPCCHPFVEAETDSDKSECIEINDCSIENQLQQDSSMYENNNNNRIMEPIAITNKTNLAETSIVSNTSSIGCVSFFDIGVKADDLNIDDLDKLKDYDREVLYFSDAEDVICIDDDDD